eukprot:88616-Alexandrium_andersonii.AAC.1
MSASLVGSEMCIRDSLGPPWSSSANPQAKAATALRNPLAKAEKGAAAVSYTHLTLPTICSV